MIFKNEDLIGLRDGTVELQQKALLIKQRFDNRKLYYLTVRNSISDLPKWSEFNDIIIRFDQNSFAPWTQRWANVYRLNRLDNYLNFFTEGNNLFNALENAFGVVRPDYLSSEQIELLRRDVLGRIEQDILSLKTDVLTEFKNGINNLVELKSELGIYQNFSENIKQELGNNKRKSLWFLVGFITTIVSISALLIGSFFIEYFKDWSLANMIAIKLSITIPLGLLSYFLFAQYKLAQMITMKFTHLNGFLGGGVTYIGQLMEQDQDAKREINKRLAQMFIELDDIMINVKGINHPTEETLNILTGKIDSVSSSVSTLLNSLKEVGTDKLKY